MARRRKTSLFEDLFYIASRLPWWLSVLIAFVAWFLFHSYAISPPPTATADPKQFSGLMVGTIFRTFAVMLQYVVPLVFGLGAIGSIFASTQRRKLVADVASATKPGKTIEGISWQQFEQLTGEAFRRQGFTVTETGGNGPDGGIDLILHKDREKYLVQCKQWRSLKVGVMVIREFFGVIAAEGAVGGFVVTSGAFTAEAKAFASGRNIRLVEGAELNRWIAVSRGTQSAPPVRALAQTSLVPVPVQLMSLPYCPICRSAMQKRTAKRGANMGKEFWGCSQYPGCRGIVSI
ncbi:MAG: restriction endonuclease [Pseudomonas sp.]|nr:restriction endonuclease [Pseudomonas sp.]